MLMHLPTDAAALTWCSRDAARPLLPSSPLLSLLLLPPLSLAVLAACLLRDCQASPLAPAMLERGATTAGMTRLPSESLPSEDDEPA